MKLAAALALFATPTLLVPAVAAACPAAAEGARSCGGSVLGYVAAVAIGLAAGVGSVMMERKLRK